MATSNFGCNELLAIIVETKSGEEPPNCIQVNDTVQFSSLHIQRRERRLPNFTKRNSYGQIVGGCTIKKLFSLSQLLSPGGQTQNFPLPLHQRPKPLDWPTFDTGMDNSGTRLDKRKLTGYSDL